MPGGAVDKSFAVGINDSTSDVAGALSVTLTNLKNAVDACDSNSEKAVDTDPGSDCDGDLGDLGEQTVGVMKAKPGHCISDTPFTVVNTVSALENYDGYPISTGLVLAPGDTACVLFEVSLPIGADDRSQGDAATFDMKFDIVQST